MSFAYKYVGPSDLIPQANAFPIRKRLSSGSDIESWLTHPDHEVDLENLIASTYVIDLKEQLYVAHRRSEHVACARVQDVLAAGEIFFPIDSDVPEIERITNQSTGYCPASSSWFCVEKVLARLQVKYPTAFEPSFEFRKCTKCLQTTILKIGIECCLVCGQSLEPNWNFDQFPPYQML